MNAAPNHADPNATRIAEIETLMQGADFWREKERAQAMIKELGELKSTSAGAGKYDKGDAIFTIFSGAGGDDAEDFSGMLFRMYEKYAESRGWGFFVIHRHENDHGGFRNVSFEIAGKNAYGDLKNESGVHRLVRVSPFNAKKLRHTSFSLVEVIPKFPKNERLGGKFEIPESEISVEFARSSGPGGQNANKRETAVRVVHLPTKLSASAETERSQERNRERAMEILAGKLYKFREEERQKKEAGMFVSKTTEIEWGNQIRSYVLHPYKMVKDHRTGVETAQVEAVLEKGEIGEFIEAERGLGQAG